MTYPSSPVAAPERYPAPLLPRDTFRSLIAAAIVVLTLGGWIYVMMIPVDRFALSAQTKLWWIEQVVGFVLAPSFASASPCGGDHSSPRRSG